MQSVCLKFDGIVIELLLVTGLVVCKNALSGVLSFAFPIPMIYTKQGPKVRAIKVNAKCVSQSRRIVIEILLLTGLFVSKNEFLSFPAFSSYICSSGAGF